MRACATNASSPCAHARSIQGGTTPAAQAATANIEQAYTAAFVDVNKNLRALKAIDDSMSGTTASAWRAW